MIKTFLMTVFLLIGSMPALASDIGTAADAGAVVNSITNNVQATPQHDHTKHVPTKPKRSKKAHDHSKHNHKDHDHKNHAKKDHAKKNIPAAKPTDKEYPIGVVHWPKFEG